MILVAAANSAAAVPAVAAAPAAAGRFVSRAFSDASSASFSKRTICDSTCRDKVDRPYDPVDAPPT